MSPSLAAIVVIAGIAGLFFLGRDGESRASWALWLPSTILLLNGSRGVTAWLSAFGLVDAGPQLFTTDQFLEGTPADRNVSLCLILLCLLVLLRRRRTVRKLLAQNGPILLFYGYCFLSVAWSDYPFVALKRWFKGTSDLLLVLVLLSDTRPLLALGRVFSRISFILLPLSILFIKYFPELGRTYNQWTFLPSHTGVTTNKNTLGMLCLFCGLGSLWQLVEAYMDRTAKNRAGKIIAHSSILAMTVWLLMIADSKTSLVCFLVAGALLVLTSASRWARKASGVHLLVASAIGATAAVLFLDLGSILISAIGRDPTLTGRTEIWKVVLDVSGNPLIGSGFESFWAGERLAAVWARTMDGLNEAHNGYLEVYLNLGWIGVLLLATLIVSGYRKVLFAFRQNGSGANLRIALFVVTMIYCFTEAGFRETSLVWISFLISISYAPVGQVATSVHSKRLQTAPARISLADHGWREVKA